ncbi:MAG: hypothetical protein VR64_10350 [Desulfatitalea sp. BRH_c12]|nr:MAG: hypothetical protein VR64_10350 [Desulfatitalea sp. BRH_c12]
MTGLRKIFALIMTAGLLVGCTTIPSGPSVAAWPAPGKTFENFQEDDAICRQWADQQAGGAADQVANQNVASGAAVGALTGAAVGAVIGAASGHAGAGAAIGAGTGLIGGAAVASGPAYAAGSQIQRRYDIAYQQCMYSKGNDIPGLQPRRTYSHRADTPPPPPPPPPPPVGRTQRHLPPPPPPPY